MPCAGGLEPTGFKHQTLYFHGLLEEHGLPVRLVENTHNQPLQPGERTGEPAIRIVPGNDGQDRVSDIACPARGCSRGTFNAYSMPQTDRTRPLQAPDAAFRRCAILPAQW